MSTTNPYATITRTGNTFTYSPTAGDIKPTTYTLHQVLRASYWLNKTSERVEDGLHFVREALALMAKDFDSIEGAEALLVGASAVCASLQNQMANTREDLWHELQIIKHEVVTAGEV